MIPAGIMDLVNRDKNGWHVYASATVIVGESYNLANPYFKATFRVKDGVIGGTDVSPWIDQSRAILAGARLLRYSLVFDEAKIKVKAFYSNNNSGGSGGSVTVLTYTVDVKKAENGILIASLTSASKGQTVTVTARPHTGYVLDKVTAKTSNGVTVDLTKKAEDKFTFTMPNSKVKVEAVFLPKEKETEEHTQKETEEEPEKNTEENSPVAEEKSNYTDVDATRWSKGAIDYVYSKGLMFGVSETEFGPAISTSRGMIVTALYRLEGKPAVEGENPFCDVAAGSYYEKAITWAVTNNIVAGYGEGEFGPDDTITREQLAAILYRFCEIIIG